MWALETIASLGGSKALYRYTDQRGYPWQCLAKHCNLSPVLLLPTPIGQVAVACTCSLHIDSMVVQSASGDQGRTQDFRRGGAERGGGCRDPPKKLTIQFC